MLHHLYAENLGSAWDEARLDSHFMTHAVYHPVALKQQILQSAKAFAL